ncbi:UNVERIFIED_CONTAM: FadR/GntR family transcriptional regulator [Methylobacteriaceae bacterium AG10]|nr:FadR/GntR family transcriptional regulator [Methylobacteriaceae bacterium AG10]
MLRSIAQKSSLVEDAIRMIERSIRENLSVGERLPSEAEMSRQLQVSRPVVREALAFLRADGLVESRQGQGLFATAQSVLRMRVEDLRPDGAGLLDLLEMRRALEAETARLAAARRTPADIERLRAALDAMAEADAAGRDGVAEDLAFHLAIAATSRNPLLIKMIHFWSALLQDTIAVIREADKADDRVLRTRQMRHAAIFHHIEAGDAEAAHRAMIDHMSETLDRFRAERGEGPAAGRSVRSERNA